MTDAYLAALAEELRRRGASAPRGLEEIRDHLSDAVESGLHRGMTREEAERDAVLRMGDAAMVAQQLADAEFVVARAGGPVANAAALSGAILAGLAIAYIDSRPHWDDAGITAFAMIAAALVIAAYNPRHPWLWALGVGVWIPLHAIARSENVAAAVMFVVVVFPMAGAYLGAGARKILTS